MPITSATALIEALQQSRLLEPEQLEELCGPLIARFPQPVPLARELLRCGWITPYQLQQLSVGQGRHLVVGQYVVREPLGAGSMGRVFKARHRHLHRLDALKVIRTTEVAPAEVAQCFLREARAAALLNHSGIVAIYDADAIDGLHYLAMELVDGPNLDRQVEVSGPLPATWACEYARQCALALQHAHERGLVHRDIKPSNLLLTADGRQVKVLDMGLAHGVDAGDMDQAGSPSPPVVMGTPDYMAPEQALAFQAVDARADLYSLGCTLYFLLTGQPPFPRGSLPEKLLQHQQDEPPPVNEHCPDLPLGLAVLLRCLLAKRPEERLQTAGEVAAALIPFAVGGARELDLLPPVPVRRGGSGCRHAAADTAKIPVAPADPGGTQESEG